MAKTPGAASTGVLRMAHLSSPWIEAFTLRSLTEDSIVSLPHVVQITQRLDSHFQTFVSDGKHMVLTKLKVSVLPGFYRITDYEICLEDASDTTGWNRLMKNSAVFQREKYAVYLSVKALTKVGGLLEDTVIGDPQILINSVEIRRVLSLPRGTLRSRSTIDAVVASTQPQIVPLGNVADALASEELLEAIQQSIVLSDDDDDGGQDNMRKKKPRNAQPPQSVEEDDADDIMLASNSTESKTEDDDMGIDAMMIQEEDKPPDVPEAPIEREEIGMLHRNPIAAKDTGDDNSDATPPIQNHRPLAPPRRMPHHGGETIRAWMTAESTVQTPSRKPAVQKDAYSYGGDFIRAWILLKNDSVDSAF